MVPGAARLPAAVCVWDREGPRRRVASDLAAGADTTFICCLHQLCTEKVVGLLKIQFIKHVEQH